VRAEDWSGVVAYRMNAVIFDLDGVLCDTVSLHLAGWRRIAGELGLPFDPSLNDRLRGLSREDSLALVLGPRAAQLSDEQKADLLRRKNEDFLARVAKLSPRDLYPGVRALLEDLRRRGVPAALASSSRNARIVIQQLGVTELFSVVVDRNDVDRSKPDPAVLLTAAERLGVQPPECVVIEDGASGVEAALAAGMRVVGVGPPQRVGRAHRAYASLAELTAREVLSR